MTTQFEKYQELQRAQEAARVTENIADDFRGAYTTIAHLRRTEKTSEILSKATEALFEAKRVIEAEERECQHAAFDAEYQFGMNLEGHTGDDK